MAEAIPGVPWCDLVRADNPSPMTLDGTNTYLIRTDEGTVVIDPGPLLADHVHAVTATDPPPVLAIVTHHHPDHSEASQEWHRRTGAPVRALDADQCVAGEPLTDGELITCGAVRLRVLHTPGHTADSICLNAELDSTAVLFSGDTILGRGTSIVAHPDGRLGDYLASLQRLRETARAATPTMVLLPAHGPPGADVATVVDEYISHRHMRLDQVRAAVASGARTAQEVVEIVYADVDRSVWGAARSTVEAQLDYLRSQPAGSDT